MIGNGWKRSMALFASVQNEDGFSVLWCASSTCRIRPAIDSLIKYKYLLLSSYKSLCFYVFLALILFKMHTLEIVASQTRTNSSVQEIEVRRTTTIYCSHHWFIIFRYHNGDNIIAEVNRTQYAEWTWNFGLHTSNIVIKFNITNKCLQIQDLATSICILEGHGSSKMAVFCHCSQWM